MHLFGVQNTPVSCWLYDRQNFRTSSTELYLVFYCRMLVDLFCLAQYFCSYIVSLHSLCLVAASLAFAYHYVQDIFFPFPNFLPIVSFSLAIFSGFLLFIFCLVLASVVKLFSHCFFSFFLLWCSILYLGLYFYFFT